MFISKEMNLGIDGVAILIQGEFVRDRQQAEEKLSAINNPTIEFIFFQSKSGIPFDYGNISKFFDGISGFFLKQMAGESDQMDDLIGAMEVIYEFGVGKRNPKLSCYYVTTGNYEKPSRIEKLKKATMAKLDSLNIFDTDTIVIEFVGAKELQQWYRAATSSVDAEIEFPRNVVMPTNNNVEEAYIGYIDAENLLKLLVLKDVSGEVAGINRAVFFDNIRDYDPKSKINLSIKDGVKSGGSGAFVFRNNGITVVSKSIDRTGDCFKLVDFQIVNGCQTSNVIFEIVYGERLPFTIKENVAKEIKVPFRLIGSRDDEFVSSIIFGTNRQNPVRDDQFWALRPFMKSFEEYCRNLRPEEVIYLERRDNQYRNQAVERTRIMQPSVLMKAVVALLFFQPQRAGRDYRGVVAEYGKLIFLEEHHVEIYHAVAYLYYRLEFLWRNQKLKYSYRTFRYYILAGIGLRMTGAQNVFGMKQNKIAALAKEIIDLAKDEDTLKRRAGEMATFVQKRLVELKVNTQEKTRDAIRSEAFLAVFREKVLSSKGTPK